MTEFLTVAFAYPTVVFTVLLVVASLYWLMVIVGAMGIDLLDFDVSHSHGATEGAAHGAAEAAAHGAAEAATHGAAEAAVGAAKGATHAVEAGIVGSALMSLNLRNAPMTLVLSIWLLMAWLASYFGAAFVVGKLGFSGSFVVGTGLALVSLIVALPVTSVLVHPLGRVLKVERQTTRTDLIGKVVTIDTSRVDARFGTAKAEDGGGGLIVQVRCDNDNELARGARALVLSFDDAREAYEVTPLDDILPSRRSAAEGPDGDAKLPVSKATRNGASEDVQ